MPLEKFSVEIESLKLDLHCSRFFVNKSITNRVFETQFLLVVIYEHAIQKGIEFKRLDFHWEIFFLSSPTYSSKLDSQLYHTQ